MDAIELQCPSCNDLLELDAGFAGGVCRCSSCGTLMTVPADPTRQRAERLSRPDRPDNPGAPGFPAPAPAPASGVGAGDAASGGGDGGEVPSAPVRVFAAPGTSGGGASGGGGAQTYVTASGQTVQVSRQVPTARKRQRRGVRVATLVLFALAMLLVIGAAVAAVVILGRDTGKLKNTGTPPPAFPDGPLGVNPGVNPLKTTKAIPGAGADFFGLTLGARTALVVDCSTFVSGWFASMRDVLVATAQHARSGDALQIVLWTEDGKVQTFPAEIKPLSPADVADLRTFLLGAVPTGVADPVAGVEMALRGKPDKIIFVTGQSLSKEKELPAIARMIDKAGGELRGFDVVMIGDHMPELQKLAADHKGRYIFVPADTFQKWVQEAYPPPDAPPAGAGQ